MTADKNFIGYGLHDAVLERLTIDWIKGTVEVRLLAVTPTREDVLISAEGLVDLTCPRQQPWGNAEHVTFVNDVRLAALEPTLQQLELELGSGDVIVLTARQFTRIAPQVATSTANRST